ncbi:gliding motility-associated C-terminal domain-containing protein [Cyclobacterium sp. 1_MG-2023]|uniref:gliding motility-associated C-terminal domain-containing protein n=1 Tax=Cyclobacterium sp. 1_MG-2023 TaxID=3062681 RepID=UPI0026E22FBE|nr:gliding motility-associated C-terminal domain-containing protein [Cyclobacterium sp. 1_MG-2023]MDO6438869.1 gliding motility-associated C-terminal domain-containing protein [Cyclobacterium sp. 1_MG-2023]
MQCLKQNWLRRLIFLILLSPMVTNVFGQCNQNYDWAVWSSFTGQSATGIIKHGNKDITMEMSANYDFSYTNVLFNYTIFQNFKSPIPNQTVPRTTWTAGEGGETTMCFSEVVSNPVLLLSSIGRPDLPVTLELSIPFVPLFDGGGMTFVDEKTIIGNEGYTILLFPGEFECITIFSSTPEYYTNITWGLNPPLFPVTLSGDTKACDETTITASGGDHYEWSGGETPNSASNTFTASGTYFLIVKDNNDCEVTTSVEIEITKEHCPDCAGTINGTAVLDDCGICLEPSNPSFNQSCIDCSGTVNGAAVIDDCGECLVPSDPAYNQTCVDCAGTINGTAVVDDCNVCLEPTDPSFNQSCIDCAGTVNGTAVIDDCGICLEPSNLSFNQSCVDCAGTVNGAAVIDDCGECFEPTDPLFNNSCKDTAVIRIPDAFSPNGDGINDTFEIIKSTYTNAKVVSYSIFSRWGELVYHTDNFDFDSTTLWWDGKVQGKKASSGSFAYFIEVEFQTGEIKRYKGIVKLIL